MNQELRIKTIIPAMWKLLKSPMTLTALMVLFLMAYLTAGFYTELRLLLDKIPKLLFEDFLIYQKAVELTFKGVNPYITTGTRSTFFYPPPSLLVVEVFSHIKPLLLRVATYSAVNILFLVLIVRGVAKKYGLSTRETWYWYVLCLGFAPFLELLTIGQINLITMFGIFLMFYWENKYPILSGFSLAVAIITKVTPILLFGYLFFNRKFKIMLATIAWILASIGLTALRYGPSPLVLYPRAFQDLSDTFVLNKNSQSLVAKLVTIANTNEASPISTFIIENYQHIQSGLMVYLFITICLSLLFAFLGKQRQEPALIITLLAMMLSPNVMWYHHYIFILLPLLIWMGWSRLDKRVVAWCLLGFFIIQVDRWFPPYGLLIHIFSHVSLLSILVWQIVELRKTKIPPLSSLFRKEEAEIRPAS